MVDVAHLTGCVTVMLQMSVGPSERGRRERTRETPGGGNRERDGERTKRGERARRREREVERERDIGEEE